MQILALGATLERVFQGCTFAEGPAANATGDVFFSDSPENRILVYHEANEITEVWKAPSGRANGMNFDAQGRLVVCCDGKDGGARAVQRYEHDGRVTMVSTHYNGKRVNSPNDLCFDREGRIYFTDPRYGYKHDLEQDCMAVYRIEHNGSLTRVIDDMETPNGILISEDNQTLYVVDHNPELGGARTLVAYQVDSSGRWKRHYVLADFGDGYGGDGMVMDIDGNIYLTAGEREKAGVYVFSPDGKLLEWISTPETPGNCTFGGSDLQTLYIAATTSLYRIRTTTPGLLTYPPRNLSRNPVFGKGT